MSVQRVEVGAGDRRRAPVPNGPVAEILIGADADQRLGAVHVVVPPGGGMPPHDHGASETLLIPLSGHVRLADAEQGGDVTDLEPGALATIPVGQRVTLQNPTEEEARLLVILAPADFAARLRDWPPADASADA